MYANGETSVRLINIPNIFLHLSFTFFPQKRSVLSGWRLEEADFSLFLSPLDAILPAEMKHLSLSTVELAIWAGSALMGESCGYPAWPVPEW